MTLCMLHTCHVKLSVTVSSEIAVLTFHYNGIGSTILFAWSSYSNSYLYIYRLVSRLVIYKSVFSDWGMQQWRAETDNGEKWQRGR